MKNLNCKNCTVHVVWVTLIHKCVNDYISLWKPCRYGVMCVVKTCFHSPFNRRRVPKQKRQWWGGDGLCWCVCVCVMCCSGGGVCISARAEFWWLSCIHQSNKHTNRKHNIAAHAHESIHEHTLQICQQTELNIWPTATPAQHQRITASVSKNEERSYRLGPTTRYTYIMQIMCGAHGRLFQV